MASQNNNGCVLIAVSVIGGICLGAFVDHSIKNAFVSSWVAFIGGVVIFFALAKLFE